MNTKIFVKKTTAPDNTYFIRPKYAIVDMVIGSTTALTNCTLQTIRVGWDTSNNYDLWKTSRYYDSNSGVTHLSGRDITGIQGTMGELAIDTLDHLTVYNLESLTPDSDM